MEMNVSISRKTNIKQTNEILRVECSLTFDFCMRWFDLY